MDEAPPPPASIAIVQQQQQPGGDLEEEVVIVDEDALSRIIDNVAMIAKSARNGAKPAEPAVQSYQVVGGGTTNTKPAQVTKGTPPIEKMVEIVPADSADALEEEEERKAARKDRKEILTALFVGAVFVGLVAVAVSMVSAFKFCSNGINERRYQQTYDSDLPSERGFFRPLFSGRRSDSTSDVV